MILTISNLPSLDQPDRFHALFGRYVYGYRPKTHCDDCLIARRETAIHPSMTDGKYTLRDELFYLCGVGRKLELSRHPQGSRRNTNVHLAVRPRQGSVAAIGSVYGTTFVIGDAEAIPIVAPARTFKGLSHLDEKSQQAHLRCKMFQFAYQMFDGDEIGPAETNARHRLRPEWVSVAGIRQDGNGSMMDPGRLK